VDAGGATTLAPDGVDPDPDPNWQYFWGIAADGSGGAVLVYTEAWTATPRTRLHVQRVDAAGVPAWGADGRVLDDGSGDALALAPQLVADGGGGALVAWLHDRASGPHELRAARVDSSGMATWTRVVRDGVRFLTLVQRFDGDALLAWDDDPGTSQSDITAQRFDLATGAESWGPGGVLVTTARSIQHHPRVAPVGCATVLAWLDVRTSFSSVWAQRLDAQGAPGTAADALLFVEKSADDRDVALRWDGAERCTEWHVVRGGQGALLDARDLTPGGVPGPTWSDAGALHDARDAYYVIW
jgi:hypothetical protein